MIFIEFIQDHRWWVLAISLPLLAIYGRVLVMAVLGVGTPPARPVTAPIRRLSPKPGSAAGTKPGSLPTPPEGRQEVLPNSGDSGIRAGISGHQKAGAAKTVKLPVTPTKPTDSPASGKKPATDLLSGNVAADSEAEAMDGLFGKRDEPAEVSSETPSVALRRKASRMEELGFHYGIASDKLPADKPMPADAAKSDVASTLPDSAPILPDGAPRSSTAELTSILERIDKFLAEDTPSKPAGTLPVHASTTAMMKTVSLEDVPAAIPVPSAADQTAKPTEAMAKPAETKPDHVTTAPTAKPDPNKKTQPMWARPDAMDEDVETPKKNDLPDAGKGDQQRLF